MNTIVDLKVQKKKKKKKKKKGQKNILS